MKGMGMEFYYEARRAENMRKHDNKRERVMLEACKRQQAILTAGIGLRQAIEAREAIKSLKEGNSFDAQAKKLDRIIDGFLEVLIDSLLESERGVLGDESQATVVKTVAADSEPDLSQ